MRKCLPYIVVAVLGCGDAADEKVESPLPSVEFVDARAEVTLPKAEGAEQPASPVAEVLLTSKHLLIRRDDYPIAILTGDERKALGQIGLPKRYKRTGPNDLFISPLYQGLAFLNKRNDQPGKAMIVVLADRSTPFRALLEVVYTAGQAELRAWIGVAPRGKKAIPTTIPQLPDRRTRLLSRTLNLVVTITADGIVLKTSTGNIATGCTSIGYGVTIPKKEGAHDYAALTACAKNLKASNERFAKEKAATLTANPDIELQLAQLGRTDQEVSATLTANPDIELQVVVDTMVALRDPALFRDIALGVAR